MPINPLIALQAQPAQFDTNRLISMAENPLSERVKTNRAVNQSARQQSFTEAEMNRFKSIHQAAQELKPVLEQGDVASAQGLLERRLQALKTAGINTDQTQQGLEMLRQDPTGQTLLQTVNNVLLAGERMNIVPNNIPTSIKDRNDLIGRLPVDSSGNLKPESEWTVAERAAAVESGIAPRAVGSAAITTATQGLTRQVAGSEATIAGAKAGASESAELDAQLAKLPEVKSAVTAAEERIKNEVEFENVAKKNSITLNMYETAMKGLAEGLAETETGPVAGRVPAVTAGQQIAEGAVSAMAPILKSMFRTAGEGTFTDKDQELLLAMVPTRKDHPEARKAKMANIDAIVRAKLGQPGQSSVQDDPLGLR